MIFKPGDLVWAHLHGGREYPSGVIESIGGCDIHPDTEAYHITGEHEYLCGSMLRPRRDDYQQKEKLGSMDVIAKLKEKQPESVTL